MTFNLLGHEDTKKILTTESTEVTEKIATNPFDTSTLLSAGKLRTDRGQGTVQDDGRQRTEDRKQRNYHSSIIINHFKKGVDDEKKLFS